MQEINLLMAFSCIGFIGLTVTGAIVWRVAPGGEVLGLYVIAGALTTASAIVDPLRYVTTPQIAVALSIDLTLAAMTTAYAAARRLLGLGPMRKFYIGWAAVGGLLVTWFIVVTPNYQLRSVIYGIVASVITGSIAVIFLQAKEPGLTIAFRIVGSVYGLYAVVTVLGLLLLPRDDLRKDTLEQPADVLRNQLASLPLLFVVMSMLVMVIMTRAHTTADQERQIAEETSAALLSDSWEDPVTNLASRARIRSILRSWLVMLGTPGLLLIVTLDGTVAEEYGHQVADEALLLMASHLKAGSGGHPPDWDSAGRWGENSLIVIAPSGNGSAEWAEEIVHDLRHLTTNSGHVVSASVGLVEVAPGATLESVEASLRVAQARSLDAGPSGTATVTAT